MSFIVSGSIGFAHETFRAIAENLAFPFQLQSYSPVATFLFQLQSYSPVAISLTK